MDRVPSAETTERLLAHTAWLTRVARAITATDDDADDVVQETWLRALERPPAHERNLRGWLATLARNLVRSRRRSRERESSRVRALPNPPTPLGPDDAIARAELQQVVLDAVLSLAEPYRSTLVLRFLDELSAEDIAKRGGEPVDTVRTRIKRGLDQVRARVAEKLGGKREELPALLAPLLAGGGAAVTSSTKVGLLVAAAATVLASTVVLLRVKSEGDARREEIAKGSASAVTTVSDARKPQEVTPREEVAAGRETARPCAASKAAGMTFDLEGTVFDLAGAPVADATVALIDRDSRSIQDVGRFVLTCIGGGVRLSSVAEDLVRRGDATRAGVTDSQGNFAFARLARSHRCRAAAFQVSGGFTELVDVEPPPDSEACRIALTLLPGIAVQGIVVDADGKRAPESSIDLDIESAGFIFGSSSGLHAGADATFSLPPIPAKQLQILAIDATETYRSERVALRAEDGVGLRQVTLRLGREAFTVGFHGRVLGPDGRPLTVSHPFLKRLAAWEGVRPGARLFDVFPIHGRVAMAGERYPNPKSGEPEMMVGTSSFNDKTGAYTCRAPLEDDLLPSCIAVLARGRVLAVAPLDESQLFGDGDHEVSDLVVEANCLRSEEFDSTHVNLVVKIVDSEREGALGSTAKVTFFHRGDDGRGSSMLENFGSDEPQVMEPGRCAIVARCRGYVPDWTFGDFTARAEPYVVTLELRRAVRATRGVVVDGDHQPVANARVYWFGEAAAPSHVSALDPVTTDAEGRFEFEGVAAARGRLAVDADSYRPSFVEVGSGNEDAIVNVELKRGVSVTFSCAPTAGGSAPGGNLRILQDDHSIVREDWTAPFARPKLEWPRRLTLAPGKYRYRVEFTSRADDEGEFVASDGAEIVVTPSGR